MGIAKLFNRVLTSLGFKDPVYPSTKIYSFDEVFEGSIKGRAIFYSEARPNVDGTWDIYNAHVRPYADEPFQIFALTGINLSAEEAHARLRQQERDYANAHRECHPRFKPALSDPKEHFEEHFSKKCKLTEPAPHLG
jgi:hypothetical protein